MHIVLELLSDGSPTAQEENDLSAFMVIWIYLFKSTRTHFLKCQIFKMPFKEDFLNHY